MLTPADRIIALAERVDYLERLMVEQASELERETTRGDRLRAMYEDVVLMLQTAERRSAALREAAEVFDVAYELVVRFGAARRPKAMLGDVMRARATLAALADRPAPSTGAEHA